MMPPRARISPEDTNRWQRQAHDLLGHLLAKHATLQTLRWSLAPHGRGLQGEVSPPSDYTDAYSVELVFAEWQQALGLTLRPGIAGRLVAAGRIDGCHVTIFASLPNPLRKDLK